MLDVFKRCWLGLKSKYRDRQVEKKEEREREERERDRGRERKRKRDLIIKIGHMVIKIPGIEDQSEGVQSQGHVQSEQGSQ